MIDAFPNLRIDLSITDNFRKFIFQTLATILLSLECKITNVCISGYARLVTVVKQFQRSRTNPIYLNAGVNVHWCSITERNYYGDYR